MGVGLSDLTNRYEGLRYSPSPCESLWEFMEMNIHVPQSLQTRNELIQLASVPTQIITPKDSKPIVSIVQDVALGVYRITKDIVFVNEKQLFNLMASNPKFVGNLPPPIDIKNHLWSGRQLLSTILPPNVNYKGANKSYDEKKGNDIENYVIIENGEIKQGRLDTKIYQDRTRGLIHSIYNEYGPEETRIFLDNTQQLICNWLLQSGFSTGISDLVVDEQTMNQLGTIIHKMKVEVYDIIRNIHMNKFQNDTRKSNNDKFEEEVNRLLNGAIKEAGKVGLEKINDYDNRMINMIKSGAKGNTVNISQMIACLGQQNVDGKRIAYGFDHRTLPHYNKYDDGPESRGFVENSFIKGLTPQEFFFHSMGGREGLIDTAVKTSSTGYIQRKLVKAMEDCKVSYDMTVRNANGNIVQFLYGEDGMDAIKIESQPVPYIEMTPEKMQEEYLLSYQDDLTTFLNEETLEKFLKGKSSSDKQYDDWTEATYSHYKQLLEDREFLIKKIFDNEQESLLMYPVSFSRILNNTHALYSKYKCTGFLSDLNPLDILESIEYLCSNLYISKHHPGNKLFQILVRMYLSPKQIIYKYGFDSTAFAQVVQQIQMRFYDSIVHPSEMVGVVAAQSIGEPATQLTLNSVEWNTEMLFKINGTIQRVKMGAFIDEVIENTSQERLENHPNDTTLAWTDKDIQVLSVNENGIVDWKKVEAVTKHPPMNEDGTGTLVRILTKSGREVIATKAKSFLKRDNNHIVPVRGDELKIGDYVPISTILPIVHDITLWDLSIYLSKKQYIYTSEVEKALNVYKEGKRQWYKRNNGTLFEVPYSRIDGFLDAFVGVGKNKGKGRRCNIIKSNPNCVYPKNTIYQPAHIPEYLPLDAKTGFFMGAYCAEGCVNKYQVSISNIDDGYCNKIQEFYEQYGISYHIVEKKNERGHTKSIIMHSVVFAELISKSFGKGAANKRIPAELFSASLEFWKHFIDGYISGDGCIDKKINCVSAASISKGLLQDIQQILTMFGIKSSIVVNKVGYENAIKRYKASVSYLLKLNAENSAKFAQTFSLCIDNKQERLNKRVISKPDNMNIIPDIITEEYGTISLPRHEVSEYLSKTTNENDKQVYENILKETIFYDKIVEISEETSEHKYVYDLTVQDTKNFNIYTGLAMRDTFHLSGVSSASKAVRGVPRIEELTRVTKNVKAPSMIVYIKDEYNENKEKCLELKNLIETTTFSDIVKYSQIYYDPDDFNTTIDEDKSLVDLYRTFMLEEQTQKVDSHPWLLRLELDQDKMLDLGITMIDLHKTLLEHYKSTICCMFSDDNAPKLIFRIRLVEEDTEDMLTELKALESAIMESIIIKGIPSVNRADLLKREPLKYDDESKIFKKKSEWYMDTDGTNLITVLGLPFVDATRTISNDVNEIYKIFGIEAARQCLYNELNGVIKDAEAYINFRHLSILVDTMTCKGTLMSIDRHGINKGDIGPLAKCSFEEVNDVIIKAGVFAELDKINGVSANIMLGQIAPCGTGDTEILLDESKLLPPDDDQKYIGKTEFGMEKYDEDTVNVQCGTDMLSFDFTAPDIDMTLQKKENINVTFLSK